MSRRPINVFNLFNLFNIGCGFAVYRFHTDFIPIFASNLGKGIAENSRGVSPGANPLHATRGRRASVIVRNSSLILRTSLMSKGNKQHMKIQILCAIAVLGLVSGCAWSGKHTGGSDYNDQNVLTGGPSVGMTIKDLPQAVKDTLRQKTPTAEISNIDRENMSGKTVYKIDFLDSNKFPPVWVAEDGNPVTPP
jgi:hypothetical protein